MILRLIARPGSAVVWAHLRSRNWWNTTVPDFRRSLVMSPPIVSVLPTRGLVDEKFKVLVENLPPGRPVTVRSLHRSEDDHYWEAFGFYMSDHKGTVNVSTDQSVGGTYTGREPMGLLWSMCAVPGTRKGLRLRKSDVCSPMLVNISVHSGHEGFRDQAPLASVLIERWYMAPGVKRIDVRDKGLKGTLFLPPGPGPFPGILDLWGGGGGLVEYRSALLASHGFATMSLDYLSSGQPVFTYAETAFNFIKDHPQVIADRVGIVALCIGSLPALYLAADSTVVKGHGRYWSLSQLTWVKAGDTLDSLVVLFASAASPFIQATEFSQGPLKNLPRRISGNVPVDENNHEMWKYVGVEFMSRSPKKVNTGKLTSPLLLVTGCDDQNAPSVEMAEDISQTMRAAGNDHLLSRLDYPDTGHLIEPPFSPHFRSTKFVTADKRKVMILWGGQTKPHSDAQEDSWRKILSFLQHHLCSSLNAKL